MRFYKGGENKKEWRIETDISLHGKFSSKQMQKAKV